MWCCVKKVYQRKKQEEARSCKGIKHKGPHSDISASRACSFLLSFKDQQKHVRLVEGWLPNHKCAKSRIHQHRSQVCPPPAVWLVWPVWWATWPYQKQTNMFLDSPIMQHPSCIGLRHCHSSSLATDSSLFRSSWAACWHLSSASSCKERLLTLSAHINSGDPTGPTNRQMKKS